MSSRYSTHCEALVRDHQVYDPLLIMAQDHIRLFNTADGLPQVLVGPGQAKRLRPFLKHFSKIELRAARRKIGGSVSTLRRQLIDDFMNMPTAGEVLLGFETYQLRNFVRMYVREHYLVDQMLAIELEMTTFRICTGIYTGYIRERDLDGD